MHDGMRVGVFGCDRRFDARGCNAGHMHLLTWIPSSVTRDSCACRREHPAVVRDNRGCSRGQMHLSCLTGASASDVRGPVLRNKSICHGGQVRPSTMSPGPVSVTAPRVSVSAALVPPDGCGCHREQMRLYRVTAAVVLVDRRACYACHRGCSAWMMGESADATEVCLVDSAGV